MMEINITEEKENKALSRKELELEVNHRGDPTPKRSEVRAKLAAEEGIEEDLIIVSELNTEYGAALSKGSVKVYDDKESLENIENEYSLERNLGEVNE